MKESKKSWLVNYKILINKRKNNLVWWFLCKSLLEKEKMKEGGQLFGSFLHFFRLKIILIKKLISVPILTVTVTN